MTAASATLAPCLEKPTTHPAPAGKSQTVDQPIQPWMTVEQLAELASKQRLMSWEEMKAQINRSLGRPLDSD